MAGRAISQRFHRIAPAFVVAGGLLLAACGGEDDQVEAVLEAEAAVEEAAVETTTTTTASPVTTTIATTTTVTPELTGFPEFTEDSSVSTVGIDAVNFGMTVNQAGRAVGGEFVPVSTVEDSCYLVRPAGGPLGVQLTVTEGTIERVDITTPDITTRSGAGVGMTEAGLAELFGDSLTTQPSPTGGNQVIFTPSDSADAEFRVIFETNGETVQSFRSGRLPQVAPTIPCSAP